MTLARRLAAVETSLTPTQLVLRWVEEAHAHGSFEGCARALLDVEPEDVPLERLCRDAERTARATITSRAREEIDRAVRTALRETAFRFLLVLRINVVAHEQVEAEEHLQFGYAGHLAFLARASSKEAREDNHRSALAAVARIILTRLNELEAAAEARRLAEERYLEGQSVLFPDAAVAWDACVDATRQLLASAGSLAEIDGVDLSAVFADAPDGGDRLFADLVAWSKATALEKLGEGASRAGDRHRVVAPEARPIGDLRRRRFRRRRSDTMST